VKRVHAWGKRVILGFLNNNCSMHAAGLTYFALLAIVPVLCCILVAAKACRVDQYARTQINARIDALIANVENGQADDLAAIPFFDTKEQHKKRIAAEEFAATARKISNSIFERVEDFDVGTLGWIGFGFLLWTVISSLASVETSFNEIFGVKIARPLWKRAILYLFVMVIVPVMATVAMSLPVMHIAKNIILATLGASWLTRWASDGLIWVLDSSLVRFAFTLFSASLSFMVFFWLMPNCRVRLLYAWWGGVFTALLIGGWMKLCAVAQVGIARSSALYGSFAFLPIVLAWLYMSWQIVLLGANMVKAFDTK